MIKDEAFYATLEKAANSLASRKLRGSSGENQKLLCSSVSELENLVDAYLQTDMNYLRTGLSVGLSPKMVTHRIGILIGSGLDINKFYHCEPLRQYAEEVARLYSDGLNHQEIANALNVSCSTINKHVRRLKDQGLVTIDDEKRERASLKKCCALHLLDLYLHHAPGILQTYIATRIAA